MRFSALPALLGLLALSLPALGDAPVSLADLGQDAKLTAAFDKMAAGQEIPDWVRGGAVTSPAGHAGFDGRDYLVLTGCKDNDCASNQIALLYHPETGEMFGLLATGEQTGQQQLNWLNIGGNAESIDGRTILFAATTGSLDNHPAAFNYNAPGGAGEALMDATAPAPAPITTPAAKPAAKPVGKTTTPPEPRPLPQ